MLFCVRLRETRPGYKGSQEAVVTKPLIDNYGLTDQKCKNNVSSLALQRPDVLHRRLRRRPGSLQQVRHRRRGQSQHGRLRGARGWRPRRVPRRHERAEELSQVGQYSVVTKVIRVQSPE